MNRIWWVILDVLAIVVDWCIMYKFIGHVLERKRDKYTCMAFIAAMISIVLVADRIGISPDIRVLIVIVLGVIYMKLCYKTSIKKAVILSLFYSLLLIGMEAVGIIVVFIEQNFPDMRYIVQDNVYKVQALTTSKLLMYLCIYMVIRLVKFYEDIPTKYFLYTLIPIVANIISLFTLFESLIPKSNPTMSKLMICMSTLLISLSTGVFIVIAEKLIKESKAEAEYAVVKEKLDMQYKYYIGIENEQQKVRKLYHDMRNHISCIQLLANNEAANAYVKKIEDQLDGIKKYYDTGNHLLDIILNDKQEECANKGIDFVAEIDFEKCDFLDMLDVTSVFSNLINNAIEACQKITEGHIQKKIKLKGTYINNFFVLIVNNSKTNEVKVVKNKFVTDKGDNFVHGLGINNIKTAVYKYGGEVTIEYTEHEFVVKIILPLKEKI